jgi:hypothetical protein
MNLEMPHTVYVVVAKDTRGFKRGFEKCCGERFFLQYSEALDYLRSFAPAYRQQMYTVGEAVIGWPDEAAKDEE